MEVILNNNKIPSLNPQSHPAKEQVSGNSRNHLLQQIQKRLPRFHMKKKTKAVFSTLEFPASCTL